MTYDLLVYLSKTVGLIWLFGFFVLVVIWAYSPSRRGVYETAARSILPDAEDAE